MNVCVLCMGYRKTWGMKQKVWMRPVPSDQSCTGQLMSFPLYVLSPNSVPALQ